MQQKQPCNFITKKFVKKAPDEDEKIETIVEEKKMTIVLPDKETVENIDKEFNNLDFALKRLVYAFLKNSRKEFFYARNIFSTKLLYVKWVVNMEEKYETTWEVLSKIILAKKIIIHTVTEGKEITKWNFICIIRYKYRGKVIGEYIGKDKCVDCICSQGHKCKPKPGSVFKGRGICKICVRCDTNTTRERFYQIIEKLGGKVIGVYKNNSTGIECICPFGHTCFSNPGSIFRGNGMCKICAKNDPETAAKNFYEAIERMGGEVLEEYRNSLSKVKCRCPKGHICYPNPNNISMGHYMYKECTDSQTQSKGEKMLIENLCKLNIGTVLEGYAPGIIKRHKSNGKHLRYDATIITDTMTYFYEFHGEQHEKINRKFHKSEEDFLSGRQRDLVKVHLVKMMKNAKLVVLDYSWTKKPSEKWFEYLKIATFSEDKIVAESPIHEWIHNEVPSKESLNQYLEE